MLFYRLTASLFFYFIFLFIGFSQCPQGDITFENQAHVNSFVLLYPSCTKIAGNLNLGVRNENSDINDLSPLSGIIEIAGDLQIQSCPILRDLSELNINSINGDITLYDLQSLDNIDHLRNLETINSLYFSYIPKLKNLNFLVEKELINGDLRLNNLPSLNFAQTLKIEEVAGTLWLSNIMGLTSFNFLPELKFLNGLDLYGNSNLVDIANLYQLENNLESILIRNNPSFDVCNLEDFCEFIADATTLQLANNGSSCWSTSNVLNSCLQDPTSSPSSLTLKTQSDVNLIGQYYSTFDSIRYSLNIISESEDSIVDLTPLSWIKHIGQDLRIENTALKNLAGLENLTFVGDGISIKNNDKIENLDSLGTIKTNSIQILNNNSLIDISSLSTLHSLEYLTFNRNNKIEDLSPITGIDSIYSLTITDCSKVKSFTYPDGAHNAYVRGMKIENCDNLDSLYFGSSLFSEGFLVSSNNDMLTSLIINSSNDSISSLRISRNELLTSISLGNSLKYITNDLTLFDNPSLVSFSFDSLVNVDNQFYLSDLNMLQTLGDNTALRKIGVLNLSHNDSLKNISLFNKEMEIDSIYLVNNPSLSNCNIEPICSIVDNNKVVVSGNGQICNSLHSIYSECFGDIKNPIGDVVISNQSEYDSLVFNFPNADSILGNLTITDLNIDFNFFSQIKYIQKKLSIHNSNLESLHFFADIDFGSLELVSLPLLKSLPILKNIDTLDNLKLSNLDSLISIEGLQYVTHVNGSLELLQLEALENINGLNNIRSIDYLKMTGTSVKDLSYLVDVNQLRNLNITNCDQLLSINGLSNVDDLKYVTLNSNYRLVDLFDPLDQDSLSYLYLTNNSALKNLECFKHIKQLGRIIVKNNYNLESMDFSSALYSWFIDVVNNSSLHSLLLSELKNVSLSIDIVGNPELVLLNLESLLDCSSLEISGNDNLVDLSRINSFLLVNRLKILFNDELSICGVPFICNHLSLGKKADIQLNKNGCAIQSEVEESCGYLSNSCPNNDYLMIDNRSVDLYNANYVTCKAIPGKLNVRNITTEPLTSELLYVGDLEIYNTEAQNYFFDSLKFISQSINISYTEFLESVDFPHLEHTNGLTIDNNLDLKNISGRQGSCSFTSLSINNNDNLLEIIGFDLPSNPSSTVFASTVSILENEKLTDIKAFSQVQEIRDLNVEGNQNLTNLSFLERIFDISSLKIVDNNILKNCAIPGICYHLENDRPATIENNDIGCNDDLEILENCIVSNIEINDLKNITVFPNPTNGVVKIDNHGLIISSIVVYNFSGQLVKSIKPTNSSILDISNFPNGLYYLDFIIHGKHHYSKLIKE